MAEEIQPKPGESQELELSEAEVKELKRLEAKKNAEQKKVLDAKDNH